MYKHIESISLYPTNYPPTPGEKALFYALGSNKTLHKEKKMLSWNDVGGASIKYDIYNYIYTEYPEQNGRKLFRCFNHGTYKHQRNFKLQDRTTLFPPPQLKLIQTRG